MKILHVVTLISPDGSYGGPIRVATNQARELRRRGHEVTLVAAARDFGKNMPSDFDGVPVKLFRCVSLSKKLGFAGLTSPTMWAWLLRNIRTFDVIHIHLARDLVTLPAGFLAKMARKPIVLQTHGMIDHSDKRMAAIIDFTFTRRVLKAADTIFYLTLREAEDIDYVARTALPLQLLPNGVPGAEPVPIGGSSMRIIYLARLEEIKRPLMFVDMAHALHGEFPDIDFVLVGPDEGRGAEVAERICQLNSASYITWLGPVPPSETIEHLLDAAINVLPSVFETFPMSVLEAMSVATPSIVSNTCGLAPYIQEHGAGAVFDGSLADLLDKARSMITDTNLLESMGKSALELARGEFGMNSVVSKLERVYISAEGDH